MASNISVNKTRKTVQWGRFEFTEAEIERQITEATRRGEEELRTEPLATSVQYDHRTRRVVLELNKGSTLSVPVDLLQGLSEASPKDLARVDILSPGSEIEWPTLDQQFTIAGLLAGRFGTRRWMAELGQRGELTTSKTKPKSPATRANAKKVSRRRKKSPATTV